MEKKKQDKKDVAYVEAVGRRKRASARVRLYPASKTVFSINDRTPSNYFPIKDLEKIVGAPLAGAASEGTFRMSIKVSGGGYRSQAEAIKLGIARALLKGNPSERTRLKRGGFLTRDAREVERKKFGLRKARRAPQWTKR